MNKNNQNTNQANKVLALTKELEAAKTQAAQLQVIAQESVNRLLIVEQRLSPALLRKPNIFNILFHWKEVVALIAEIIDLIKNFKKALQKPEETNDANQ